MIMAGTYDHDLGHDGNWTAMLEGTESARGILSLFAFMRDYIMIIIKYSVV